jgi:hypothetical protein
MSRQTSALLALALLGGSAAAARSVDHYHPSIYDRAQIVMVADGAYTSVLDWRASPELFPDAPALSAADCPQLGHNPPAEQLRREEVEGATSDPHGVV